MTRHQERIIEVIIFFLVLITIPKMFGTIHFVWSWIPASVVLGLIQNK